MRSGARWGRGSRFPEGRGCASAEELVRAFPGGEGRRALVAPPRNGCSGRACAAARAGGTGTRFSRRGEGGARRVAPPQNGCSGRACAAARAGGTGTRFSRRGEGGARRVAPPQNGCSGRACAAARAGGVVRVSRRGEGGARWWPGGLCEGTAGRGGSGGLCERTAGGRRFRGVIREGAEGRWPGGLCEGTAGRGGSGGLCKRAQGTAARRVAAVPVCPPFRDRSRGGREVGAVPPVAGGCCEAGLCRCGRRGAAVPGSYARGRRGAMARRVYARGRRGRRPGGWLPCRFARHFVTGRGVVVKWGLRRRSPGVVVKRGCTAVDGGARQFRGGVCDRTAGAMARRVYARGRRGAAVPAGLCKRVQERAVPRLL